MKHNVPAVAEQFHIYGDFVSAQPLGTGHINDTYVATFTQSGTRVRYVIQRINHQIFTNPDGLMQNALRVTQHMGLKLRDSGVADTSRHCLTLVPTRSGQVCYVCPKGNYWRVYLFIENASGFESAIGCVQAYEVAKAFGRFQKCVADLPGGPLLETLPDFHNTAKRYERFEEVLMADSCGRAGKCRAEILFARNRKQMTPVIVEAMARGEIPQRVTHNDTKINNVLLDNETGQSVCVIDLDTVMSGSSLYDFGDLVRSVTNSAREDEQNLSRVNMDMPMFEALAEGYLEEARDFLNERELDLLVFSGKLITFEVGMRFLTDHMEGDVYFKTHRPNHNLDRCRTQFKLVSSIELQEAAMERFVKSLLDQA